MPDTGIPTTLDAMTQPSQQYCDTQQSNNQVNFSKVCPKLPNVRLYTCGRSCPLCPRRPPSPGRPAPGSAPWCARCPGPAAHSSQDQTSLTFREPWCYLYGLLKDCPSVVGRSCWVSGSTGGGSKTHMPTKIHYQGNVYENKAIKNVTVT